MPLPVLALPSLASLFEASVIGGAVATGVRNTLTKSTSKSNNYSLSEMVDIGMDLVSTSQSTLTSSVSTELTNFTNLLNNSVTAYQSVLPAINNVSKGLIDSSTINSGLVNTIVTSSNRSAEISKEISNALTTLNNTLVDTYKLKAEEMAHGFSFSTILKQNLEAITVTLTQIATLPKIIAESAEHSLQLKYDIHGALDFIAQRTDINTDLLSSISNSLIARNTNQASTNTKIVEGVTSQVQTNTKTNEHYDYQKSAVITASDGTQYSPREIQAKSNAEHHLDKKGHNTFDWGLGFIDAVNSLDVTDEENVLKNLFDLLKTTPFDKFDTLDNSKFALRKDE